VGRNQHAVRRFTDGDRRIELTGPVPDAVAELASAQVAVVPLLAGSGTRLKIMEAWAAGRAVVSTSLGAEGLDVRHGKHLLLADDPAGFAAAVSKLLESEELRGQLGAAGRALYERCYTWEAAWAGLRL
jgi:glycosyltransferase involved in cell wall biosynthesis